ncbi:MAG: hypothetical protein ACRCSK_05425, partial [Fusobacteriaceae bacterium]
MKNFLKGMTKFFSNLSPTNKIKRGKVKLIFTSFFVLFILSSCNTGNVLVTGGENKPVDPDPTPVEEAMKFINIYVGETLNVPAGSFGYGVQNNYMLRNYGTINNEVGAKDATAVIVYVGGTAVNYSLINANDGIGMDLLSSSATTKAQANSVGYNMEKGIINVITGIGVRGAEGSSFYNKGTMNVTNNAGIAILSQNSFVENTGNINVNFGTGIRTTGSKSIFNNNGKITASKAGKGIEAFNGSNVNIGSAGSVIAKDTSDAVYISGGAVVKNYGVISSEEGMSVRVVGTSSKFYNSGIVLSSSGVGVDITSGASAVNEKGGSIVSEEGIAVKVDGSSTSFYNRGTVTAVRGHGVYVVSGASAVNEKDGTVKVEETSGIGMYAKGAGSTVRNYGKIEVVSGVGISADENGSADNYGSIVVDNNGTGALVGVGGVFSNYGNIYLNTSGSAIKSTYETGKIDLENRGNLILKNISTSTAYGMFSTAAEGSSVNYEKILTAAESTSNVTGMTANKIDSYNRGTIYLSSTNGIATGMDTTSKSIFNEGNISIYVSGNNSSSGMKVVTGTAVNYGKITTVNKADGVSGSSDTGNDRFVSAMYMIGVGSLYNGSQDGTKKGTIEVISTGGKAMAMNAYGQNNSVMNNFIGSNIYLSSVSGITFGMFADQSVGATLNNFGYIRTF